jgi:ABC-2 type transport system permease protein
VRALGSTWLAAWQEAWANRAGFWTQVGAMAANNLVWILFWVLFFGRVGTLRGWDVEQLMVLLAVITTAAGVVLGLFNNVVRLGDLTASGALDAALTLPAPTLPYLLCRRVNATHVGDLLFGPVLFVLAGNPTPARTAVFAFGVVCAVLILTGFLVLVGSLAFLSGRGEAGDLGFNAVILFAMYPIDVFPGFARLFMYIVIPSGFLGAVPARLVDRPDPVWVSASLAAGIGFAAAGWISFAAGLRRYTSGALWTDA